jgi:hypothetical protein
MHTLSYAEAISEGTVQAMDRDGRDMGPCGVFCRGAVCELL